MLCWQSRARTNVSRFRNDRRSRLLGDSVARGTDDHVSQVEEGTKSNDREGVPRAEEATSFADCSGKLVPQDSWGSNVVYKTVQ